MAAGDCINFLETKFNETWFINRKAMSPKFILTNENYELCVQNTSNQVEV